MLKYKSIVFLFVCSFTISGNLWADQGMDTSLTPDVGMLDLGDDSMEDMGLEKSTPLDPDYQPEVTSDPECTCRSVQNKSNFGWLPLLIIGVLGFSRKKWGNSEKINQ